MKKILLLISILILGNQIVKSQTVTTDVVSSISFTTATLNATTSGLDVAKTYYIQFYYDIAPGTYGNSVSSATFTGVTTNSISFDLSGLSAGTIYNVQAVLNLAYLPPYLANVASGSVGSFTTILATIPSISTGTTGSVTSNSIDVLVNNLSDDGGSRIIESGLKAGTVSGTYDITISDGPIVVTTFDKIISTLTPSTKYFYTAYATNSAGIAYGIESSVYTPPSAISTFEPNTYSDTDQAMLTLNWIKADGEANGKGGRIIVAYRYSGDEKLTIVAPTDGVVYAADSVWGAGDVLGTANGYVVYADDTATSVQISGLNSEGYEYEFHMYEYSGSLDNEINYKTDVIEYSTTKNSTFPIELISFAAKSVNDRVEIDWATASELNNDYFVIERSFDAQSFEAVVNIPGAGNSNEVLNYSVIDNEKLEGTVYYRLKQTDFDGAYTYSSILPVTIGGTNELQISDVINGDKNISFVYNNDIDNKAVIHLIDINGRILKTQKVSGSGAQMVRLAMGNLSHGVYVIRLSVKDETIVKKIVY